MKHRLIQVNSYIGNYRDPATGKAFFTVMADYQCRECKRDFCGHPEMLAPPEVSEDCQGAVKIPKRK